MHSTIYAQNSTNSFITPNPGTSNPNALDINTPSDTFYKYIKRGEFYYN
ncbi:hypothetical protein ABW636_03945 [Aquimarina sp. 2201CG1-2-11]